MDVSEKTKSLDDSLMSIVTELRRLLRDTGNNYLQKRLGLSLVNPRFLKTELGEQL
jgi:hypothetical protein